MTANEKAKYLKNQFDKISILTNFALLITSFIFTQKNVTRFWADMKKSRYWILTNFDPTYMVIYIDF